MKFKRIYISCLYVQLIVLQNSVGAKKEAVAVWLDSLFDLQSMRLKKGKLWHIHFGQYMSIPERAPWFLWGVTEHEDHPATFQCRKLTLVHGICVKSKSVNAMRLFKGPAVGQKQRTSSSPDRAHMKLGFAVHHTACFPGDMTPTYPSCLRPNLWIPNLNCELEPARRPRWVLCAKALTAAKEIIREICLCVWAGFNSLLTSVIWCGFFVWVSVGMHAGGWFEQAKEKWVKTIQITIILPLQVMCKRATMTANPRYIRLQVQAKQSCELP